MRRYAAVAVISTRMDEILFIRRRENPNDPWSGDIAFPGGRKVGEDRHLLDTVYREVLEEVGIELDKLDVEPILIGVFSPLSFPDYKVYAYNFWIDDRVEASQGEEVDGIFWISPHSLEKGRCLRLIRFRNVVRDVDCYMSGELVIWGMTYRILKKFLDTFYF